MKYSVTKSAWALIFLAAGLVVGLGTAQATTLVSDTGSKAVATKAKKKTVHSGQVRFLPGSAEMPSERSRRLKRECKGRVNAGACAGYTG
jgi:hypothetical protein